MVIPKSGVFGGGRVSEEMPLYDILNEFQKGHSHMAVVVKYNLEKSQFLQHDRELKLDLRKPGAKTDHKAGARRKTFLPLQFLHTFTVFRRLK